MKIGPSLNSNDYSKSILTPGFKDMDLDLDHFLNLEQLIPAGFTVVTGSIF